jgi:hypothetical protein
LWRREGAWPHWLLQLLSTVSSSLSEAIAMVESVQTPLPVGCRGPSGRYCTNGGAMISWSALNRITERQIATDAKYRKKAAGRPLRSDAKQLTDEELLAKLRSFSIDLDGHRLGTFATRISLPSKSPSSSWTSPRPKANARNRKLIGSGFVWRHCGNDGSRTDLHSRCWMTRSRMDMTF